jgi:hypothetical protein
MRKLSLALLLTGCLGSYDGPPPAPPTATDAGMPHNGPADMAHATTPKPSDMAMKPAPSLPPSTDMAVVYGNPGMILCSAQLTLSGTYTQGNPPPTGFAGGCWPDGTWTFSATVTSNTCPSAPTLESQYTFKVVEDLDYNDTITYQNDPTNLYVSTKISGGEGGLCVGAFLIFSPDGKTVWNLRPALQTGNVLNGAGEYRIYDTDQRL